MKVVRSVSAYTNDVISAELVKVIDCIIANRCSFLMMERAREAERTRRSQVGLATEEVNYDRLKEQYGKRSGHPKLQRAKSRLNRLKKQRNESNARLTLIEEVIEGLEVERDQLLALIAYYGATGFASVAPDCYNARVEKNNRLNIYFSPYENPLQKGERHGHVSITRDLRVHYVRLAGEPRGYHNFPATQGE